MGPPTLPTQASVSPPWFRRGGGATLSCGWGGTQFGRLDRKPGTLYTLWPHVSDSRCACVSADWYWKGSMLGGICNSVSVQNFLRKKMKYDMSHTFPRSSLVFPQHKMERLVAEDRRKWPSEQDCSQEARIYRGIPLNFPRVMLNHFRVFFSWNWNEPVIV